MTVWDPRFVVLDGAKYRHDPEQYLKADAEPFAPVIREGHPSGDTLQDESLVGWRTWHGGMFQALFDPNQPDRSAYGTNVWTLTPGQIILGPKQQTTSGISAAVTRLLTPDAGGRVAALTATAVFYRDSGADTFTSILSGVTPTDLIEFDGNYLVGMGASTAYQYKSALSSGGWTSSTLGAAGDAQYANLWAADMKGTATSAGLLWKSVNPNKVYSSANPLNGGAWSTAYLVGSSKFSVNALKVFDDRLIVTKPEGVFWVKPDGTVQVLFSFRDAIHTSNGAFLVQTHTGVLVTPWAEGLVAFRPGATAANITTNEVWSQFGSGVRDGSSEARGRFVAAVAGPTLTYFVLHNAVDSLYWLVAWTGESPDRGWHVIHRFGTDAADVLGFEQPAAASSPRVYAKNGSSSPSYFILPRDSHDPRTDTSFRYETDGLLEFTEYQSPLPGVEKTFAYINVLTDDVSDTEYVDLYYRLDGAAAVFLTRVTSSGWSRAYFPSNIAGYSLIPQVRLSTGSATLTPRVKSLDVAYYLQPVERKAWAVRLLSGADPLGRTGPKVDADVRGDKSAHIGVAWTDVDGAAYTVLVKKVDTRLVQARADEVPEYALDVALLQQVGVSTATTVAPLAITSTCLIVTLRLDNALVPGANPRPSSGTTCLTKSLLLQREV